MGYLSNRYRENKHLEARGSRAVKSDLLCTLLSPAAHAMQLSMENMHSAISKHLTSQDHKTVFRSHKHIKISQIKFAMVDSFPSTIHSFYAALDIRSDFRASKIKEKKITKATFKLA